MKTSKEIARDLIEPFNRYLPNNNGYVTLTQNQLDELEFQIELALLKKLEEVQMGSYIINLPGDPIVENIPGGGIRYKFE